MSREVGSMVNLRTLDELVKDEMLQFSEGIKPERDIFNYVNSRVEKQGKKVQAYRLSTQLLAPITVAATALTAHFFGFEVGVHVGFSNLIPLLSGGGWFWTSDDYGKLSSQLKDAKRFDEEGYIFAYSLGKAFLIPSAVVNTDVIGLGSIVGNTYQVVKEGPLEARVVTSLSKLTPQDVGKPIVSSVRVTSARFTNGTVRFRITDPEGYHLPARMTYLHDDSKGDRKPNYALKRANFQLGSNASVCERVELFQFLDESRDNKSDIRALGKLDSGGTFCTEFLCSPKTPEVFLLGVYQS